MTKLWDALRSSFWFVPITMILATLAIAAITITTDRAVQIEGVSIFGARFPKGTSSAGTLLSAIATSILTVAGSIFSIVIIALQLASGQFGPRMLRDLMNDRTSQVTLGACSSTFIYVIVVLWAIEDSKDLSFTPQISVAAGLLLAIATTILLVFFVHHIASAIHVDNLIAKIGHESLQTIENILPNTANSHATRQVHEISANFEDSADVVFANSSGYLQRIDVKKLSAIAARHNLIIKVINRPGQFVVQHSKMAYVSAKQPLAKALTQQIQKAFSYGNQRKPEYDIEFTLKQLVEIAIRAISPAVNDPFTAIRCIDRLSVSLCRALQKAEQSAYVVDPSGALRLIINPVTFEQMTNDAFDQIRQYGKTDAAVTLRLLEAIETIGQHAHTDKNKRPLRRQAEMIERGSKDGLPEENDRQEVAQQYQKTLRALNNVNT